MSTCPNRSVEEMVSIVEGDEELKLLGKKIKLAEDDDEIREFNELYELIWKEKSEEMIEKEAERAFKVYDCDGDGMISMQDLEDAMRMMGFWVDGMDANSMIHPYDTNHDGLIDFQEFKAMIIPNNL